MNKYLSFLHNYEESEWLETLEEILPAIHEVDKNATLIWFRFHPLALHRYLQSAEDREKAMRKFVMQGDFDLNDQIDLSHRFLYGHRFWKETKASIEKRAADFNGETTNL